MVSTLRTYLKEIEEHINVIQTEVDPLTQVGDLVSQSKKTVLFQNIKGYPGWRICDLLVNDREAQARALRTNPKKVLSDLAGRFAKGKGDVNLVTKGPVKEKILNGKDVDLTKIPVCVHSPKDAGPYIGSGMCVVKDPETGIQNVAFHRMQIKSKNHTCFFHGDSPHMSAIYRKYHEIKRPIPMAVVIGHHPCYEIAAAYFYEHEGYGEHEMVGSLLNEPINIIQCETVDLEVPADAEIILEGEVPLDILEDEGPFGEGLLLYTNVLKGPIFKVDTITMRHDAIFRHLNNTPSKDSMSLAVLSFESRLFSQLKKSFNLHDIYMAPFGPTIVIIQMTAQTEQQVRDALLTTLFSGTVFNKIAIAVDEDIDIYDSQDILYALATRVNPATDIVIVDGTSTFRSDLTSKQISANENYKIGSKMGIDATKAPLIRGEERKRFERVSPKGWGISFIEDFISKSNN